MTLQARGASRAPRLSCTLPSYAGLYGGIKLIQRILQSWYTRDIESCLLRECHQTWIDQHAGWQMELYSNAEIVDWLSDRQKIYPASIQTGKPFIRTVDMFRYCQLYEYGGMYVDMDYYCLSSVQELIEGSQGGILLPTIAQPLRYFDQTISNAWMYAAEPHHPFWLLVLAMAQVRFESAKGVERASGPILLRDAWSVWTEAGSAVALSAFPEVRNLVEVNGHQTQAAVTPVELVPSDVLMPLTWGYPDDDLAIEEFHKAEHMTEELLSRVPMTERTLAFTFHLHSW